MQRHSSTQYALAVFALNIVHYNEFRAASSYWSVSVSINSHSTTNNTSTNSTYTVDLVTLTIKRKTEIKYLKIALKPTIEFGIVNQVLNKTNIKRYNQFYQRIREHIKYRIARKTG